MGSPFSKRYAAGSLRTSFHSKLRMTYKEQRARGDAWSPSDRSGSPCYSPLVESCLICALEEQKRGASP